MADTTEGARRQTVTTSCAVVCRKGGKGAIVHLRVLARNDQFDAGAHLDGARQAAARLGYDTAEAVVFDRHGGPDWLFKALLYEQPPAPVDISEPAEA